MHLACRHVDSLLFHVVGNFQCTLQIVILKFNRQILRKWECFLGETYISKLLGGFFSSYIYNLETPISFYRQKDSGCPVWLKKRQWFTD